MRPALNFEHSQLEWKESELSTRVLGHLDGRPNTGILTVFWSFWSDGAGDIMIFDQKSDGGGLEAEKCLVTNEIIKYSIGRWVRFFWQQGGLAEGRMVEI